MITSPENQGKYFSVLEKGLHKLFPNLHSYLTFKIKSSKYSSYYSDSCFTYDWPAIPYNRISLVNLLLSTIDTGARYLEIGCAGNTLFDSVFTLNKIGVDPSAGGTHRLTSNQFFKQNKQQFDVIFIDGLHTYHQVKLDIINSLKVLPVGGWIALHDMIPLNWIEANPEPLTKGSWTGDVWKLSFELIESHGLDFDLITIDHGIAVIKKTSDSYSIPDLSKSLQDQKFSYFFDRFKSLPLCDFPSFSNKLLA